MWSQALNKLNVDPLIPSTLRNNTNPPYLTLRAFWGRNVMLQVTQFWIESRIVKRFWIYCDSMYNIFFSPLGCVTSELSLEIKYSDLYQIAIHMNYKCTGTRQTNIFFPTHKLLESDDTHLWISGRPFAVSMYITNHPAEDMGRVKRDLELTGCQILMCLETRWFIRKDKRTMNEPYLTRS